MELASIKKLARKQGNSKVLRSFFINEFKAEFVKLASAEIMKTAIHPVIKSSPPIRDNDYGIDIIIHLEVKFDAERIMNRIKLINWLYVDHWVTTYKKSSEAVIGLKTKSVLPQIKKLPEDLQKIVFDVFSEIAICIIFAIDNKSKNIKSKTVKPRKVEELPKEVVKTSIFSANALTVMDLGLKLKIKYNMKLLDSIVDKTIKRKYSTATELLFSILQHARDLNDKSERVKSTLVIHDLNIVEKNFVVVAAAVSALHANPKSMLMFTSKNSFVLFKNKLPLARYGKDFNPKMTMKKKFEECKKECGSFPGDTKAIMDVLDAEGKPKKAQIKELFNDLSKHVITNSSGIAAKAARRLKKAAAIDTKINWQSFSKAFSEASTHIKEIKYSPMVERMEVAVKELHKKRNVLDLGKINWQNIFEKKKIGWLGALTADILEDEVNRKKDAKKALSCVANWMENKIDCKLSVHHLGSVGDEFKFTSCKEFKFKIWEIELQDIMKSGPKWK